MPITNKIDGFYGLPNFIIEDNPLTVLDMQKAQIASHLAINKAFSHAGACYSVAAQTGMSNDTITSTTDMIRYITHLAHRYPIENRDINCITVSFNAYASYLYQWEACVLVCKSTFFASDFNALFSFTPILSNGFYWSRYYDPLQLIPNSDSTFSCIIPIDTTNRWHSIKMMFPRNFTEEFDVVLFFRQVIQNASPAYFSGASCCVSKE